VSAEGARESAEAILSEWMKIMLEEIARKKAEEEQMRAEDKRRREEASSARSIEVVLQSAQCTDE
jgi:hypothetical protein